MGVIAAQSIGEPGTQLTMRTFHIGGAASPAAIATSVEAKSNGVIGFNATMRYVSNTKGELVVIARSGEIIIQDEHGRERERHKVPYGATLTVKADQTIKAGTILANADHKVADVEKDKERFQNDPDCRLMVLSLGAGSEGHTLTAAWHISFAQLPMTAKAFRQAVGRAHGRLNDPHPVWVHPLLAGESGTIDHDTLKRINRKGAALDAVQDGIVTDIDAEPDYTNEDSTDSLLDIFERHRNNR